MKGAILSARWAPALRDFARPQTLLAFDFDGVLAPIVADRTRARVPAELRRLLAAVARVYPCIVVSGRALADLEPRLAGFPLRAVLGNFGYEPAPTGRRPPARVRAWAGTLRLRLAPEDGVYVEDKGYSVAVHYREAPRRAAARRAIARAVADLRGARAIEGTLAVTLLPTRGTNKGTAVQSMRRALGCRRAVYVGDDGTDDDAFASAPSSRLLSIRVGRSTSTRAQYWLRQQNDVAPFLRTLMALASSNPQRRRRSDSGSKNSSNC